MRQRLSVSAVLLLSLSLTLAQSLGSQQWQRLPSSGHPPPHAFVAMAYDPGRNCVVCAADMPVPYGPTYPMPEFTTWEWDGARWRQRVTATTPTAFGSKHAAAYDPTIGRVVLVNSNGDTWSFDGADWRLEPITGAGGYASSLAFDAARGVLVLASGSGPWHGIYEIVGGAWSLRAAFPPSGSDTLIGFDPVSNRVLAFGGLNIGGPGPLNISTTLAWDGTSLATLAPATVPNGRSEHTFVNDPITGHLLLIGGIAWQSPLGMMADVHSWNGTDWVVQPSLPAPRRLAAAAPIGGAVDLFGGTLGSSPIYSSEVLRLGAAGAWTTVPVLTSGACAAHDTLRNRTVSVDGGRTLEFDGYRWHDVGIVCPAATGIAAIAFHAQLARIVAVDGANGTWLYDGLAWTQAVTPIAPPMRAGAGLGYDPVRNVIVMFGGINGPNAWLNDVWEWNGTAWSNPQPAAPPPAGLGAIAWNGASLVGISANPTSPTWTTWAWNGAAFTVLATSPGLVVGPRLAHDPALGLVAVVTPALPNTPSDVSMLFTGTAWQPINSGFVAPGVGGGSLVFDTNRGQLMLHDAVNDRELILTSLPAASQAYGATCSSYAVQLNAMTLPQLGESAITEVRYAPFGAAVFVMGDLAQANIALPGGCVLLVPNPIVLSAMTVGWHHIPATALAIPQAPSLRGVDVFEQALVLHPNGVLFGFADLTNGMRLRIGD